MSPPHPEPDTPATSADDAHSQITQVVHDPVSVVKSMPAIPTSGRHTSPLTENDGWISERYRLLEKLGEGGFGLVFKAEQVQPIHRMVAVKILKAGSDTAQVISRFETERQSLALMEHPNIARVLDAGETERGQPYFVMELVRGRSITSYCTKKGLTLRQRIELFLPVCAAVHHAHQKGIIHRDLKPSNVMVMEEDQVPTPKVIDFGIAKVLEGPKYGQTLETGMDQLVGTPGYISPEQIEHGSSHVDTRSDVYALGSILMELLTGKALITPMDVAQKPLHQILRDQVELDPPRPSSREPSLKGDLDWIVLKALERDPNRRYGSADDLANDLRRFLNHQPVTACPPSRRYLVAKFVRRHRVGVAASVAISLAVLAGGITSTALYLEAEQNRREAMSSREDLRKSYSRSDEQMARQLTDRADHAQAVAWLCRALRTDPDNRLATVNLCTLLAHEHLVHPTTPALALPAGTREASLAAISREAARVLAVSTMRGVGEDNRQDMLSIWELDGLKRIDRLLPRKVRATCLEVSRDGQHAYLAQDSGMVEVFALKDESRTVLSPRLPSSVLCLQLSFDGGTLIAGGEDGTIHCWDLHQPGKPAQVLKQKNPVNCIAIAYDGKVAATSCLEGIATVWDLEQGQPIGDPIEVDEGLATIAIHKGREWIALGMNSGVVHVGHYRQGNEVIPPLVHPAAVTALAMDADGTTLIAGDAGGYMHTWDLAKGQLSSPAQPHDGEIVSLVQSASGQGLVTTVSRHGELQVWNSVTGMRIQHRLQHSLSAVNVSNDCSMLVMAPRHEPFIQVWNIHQRMTTRRFVAGPDMELVRAPDLPARLPEKVRRAVALGWNRPGTFIAAADEEGQVTVYDLKTAAQTGATFRHPPAVGAVTLSSDGRTAITSGRDREVRIWDVATGRTMGISLRHESFVECLALSPDDQRLVTITDQGEVRVWDMATGDCLTPGIHEGEGISVATVSADGREIVYLSAVQGWFAIPMPPAGDPLPAWFLDFAEATARRRLTPEGKTENISIDEYNEVMARLPARIGQRGGVAEKWARWLMADADQRILAPESSLSFEAYLNSLLKNPSPVAAMEVLRHRPHDAAAEARLGLNGQEPR